LLAALKEEVYRDAAEDDGGSGDGVEWLVDKAEDQEYGCCKDK